MPVVPGSANVLTIASDLTYVFMPSVATSPYLFIVREDTNRKVAIDVRKIVSITFEKEDLQLILNVSGEGYSIKGIDEITCEGIINDILSVCELVFNFVPPVVVA